MSAGRICVRVVQVAAPRETARAAARRMAAEGVGTLVVVDSERHPIGIVTDRDLMFRCIAEGRSPDETLIEEIMATPLVTIREETTIEEALRRMGLDGVRRLVVVDKLGRLAGILALDDVVELLAEEAGAIRRILADRTARATP